MLVLQEYNAVPDDMRDDEETRMELHQRVDDLRERLWNICDERKEQAEAERETVIQDGWLDDRSVQPCVIPQYWVRLLLKILSFLLMYC